MAEISTYTGWDSAIDELDALLAGPDALAQMALEERIDVSRITSHAVSVAGDLFGRWCDVLILRRRTFAQMLVGRLLGRW